MKLGQLLAPKAFGKPVNCFPADTPVSAEHGLKPIQDIRAGELVWACDLTTGNWQLRPVLETYTSDHALELVEITVANETLRSTYHHPFWVIEGEDLDNRPCPEHILSAFTQKESVSGRWVDAGDLRIGDVLLLKAREPLPVMALSIQPQSGPVYNFAVDDLHCYAVGISAILVHNNSGLGGPKGVNPLEPNSGVNRPSLKRIHPDATYAAEAEAKASLEYWRTQPTDKIVESLRPGKPESLKVKPDGRMVNGNTRTKVLEERGYDINNLPREPHLEDILNDPFFD